MWQDNAMSKRCFFMDGKGGWDAFAARGIPEEGWRKISHFVLNTPAGSKQQNGCPAQSPLFPGVFAGGLQRTPIFILPRWAITALAAPVGFPLNHCTLALHRQSR
jgi:hypothetical protein